jgi:hypothetical protein
MDAVEVGPASVVGVEVVGVEVVGVEVVGVEVVGVEVVGVEVVGVEVVGAEVVGAEVVGVEVVGVEVVGVEVVGVGEVVGVVCVVGAAAAADIGAGTGSLARARWLGALMTIAASIAQTRAPTRELYAAETAPRRTVVGPRARLTVPPGRDTATTPVALR